MTRRAARRFSLVVPVYQNASNLGDTVPRLLALRERLPQAELELVFVDDGSTDASYEILREWSRREPHVIRVVKLTRNFGQTPATQAGLRAASGDCVGIISADLQEPPEGLLEMLERWQEGAQFVMAARQSRAESYAHQSVSSVYWRLVRRFAFADFPTAGYDCCVLDRQLVDLLVGINEKNSSIFVLIFWLGYRPAVVPISRATRRGGRSQWRFRRKLRFTIDTLIGFTYLPARVISGLSLAASFLSLAYLAFLTVVWLRNDSAPPGWMTLAGMAFLTGSLILFALGIIAEYLVRILDEARKRPPYVVERVDGGPASAGAHDPVFLREP